MLLETILTAVLFFAGTALSGYTIRHILKLKQEGFLFSILVGCMGWWALMEVILIPMTMKLAAFHTFVWVYTAAAGALTVAGFFCWREILEDGKALISGWKQNLTLGHLVAIVLIIWQLYYLAYHMYLEWDDTYYVNLANTALTTDKIYWVYPETGTFVDFDKRYVLSLWPIFYAWLSKLVGVLPTIMAHTILPWLILPVAYLVYVLIGRKLFPEDRELQGMFLAMAVMLHLFMSGEHTAGLTFLSITPWVGKGILATILIPALFYWILRTVEKERPADFLLLGLTCLAGCLLSSMGIMLTPVFVGTAMLLAGIRKKSIPYVVKGALACLPCVILGIYYIVLTH